MHRAPAPRVSGRPTTERRCLLQLTAARYGRYEVPQPASTAMSAWVANYGRPPLSMPMITRRSIRSR